MIKRLRHLWSRPDDEQNQWKINLGVKGNTLLFYAPFENVEDIYFFKLGDILKDTYTGQEYKAVDKIIKKARWGEERSFFIMRSLKTGDQFGLEHSADGLWGQRYHKKFRLTIPEEHWHGYLSLTDVFNPTNRANRQKSSLPTTAGIVFFYHSDGRLLYLEKTRNIRDQVYRHLIDDVFMPTQFIRQQFQQLCYVEVNQEEARNSLVYHWTQMLQPQWHPDALKKKPCAEEMNLHKPILKISLSTQDFYQYLQQEQMEIPKEEAKEMFQYIKSLEETEEMQELIDFVIQECIRRYQQLPLHQQDDNV